MSDRAIQKKRMRTAAVFFLILGLVFVPAEAVQEKMVPQDERMPAETDQTEAQEPETRNWLDEMDEWMEEQEGSETGSETGMDEEDGDDFEDTQNAGLPEEEDDEVQDAGSSEAEDAGGGDVGDAGSGEAQDAGGGDTGDAGSSDAGDNGSGEAQDVGGGDDGDGGSGEAEDAGSSEAGDVGSGEAEDVDSGEAEYTAGGEAEEVLPAELSALQEFDLDKYLPVTFVQGISSFEIFPQDTEFARVVKNGITMAAISPKNAEEQGQVGVYYRKAAVQGEKWYDLKITLAESAENEVVSKEGVLSIFSGAAFCTDRIGWGVEGRQERTVLKMEFVESDTGKTAAINARFMWKDIDLDNRPQTSLEDGSFAAHYYVEGQKKGRGNMMFLLNNCSTWYVTFAGRGQAEFEVISQEDILTAGEESRQKDAGSVAEQVKVMRREAQVRLFVSKRDPHTKRWDTDTVFEVYEWDGYDYSIYRGCLVYDVKKNCYTMEGLVRNEVNEGKYVIMEAAEMETAEMEVGEAGKIEAGEMRTERPEAEWPEAERPEQESGWRQEILVPDRAVVTDLYYRVEN